MYPDGKLHEYERHHEEASQKGLDYYENPFNKYLLIKRLTSDWEKIDNLMQHQGGKGLLKNIRKYFIEPEEYYGGIDGLLRLQDTYRLNTSDIVQGILQGVKYEIQLESKHCYDIGQRALTENFTRLSHSWLQEALKRFNEDDISPTELTKLDIELALTNVKYKLGDIRGANQSYVDLINLYPDNEKVAKDYSKFSEKANYNKTIEIDYSLDHDPVLENVHNADDFILFKYACADILKKTPTEERYLRCGYLTETHPFLYLAPIKVEELNFDPLVVLFHDVVSDNEIAIMKNLTDNIERATIMGIEKAIVSDHRTSQYISIDVDTHPVLGVIDRRVEDMTNLNMKYAERHQFANYGIGGHYAQHYDYFSEGNMNPTRVPDFHMGNRMATVLIYLSDVEQGGGTAFPILKLHLKPKKGSAVFWYNLHASGERDSRTQHGACPIIVGSKWVQNRWIREYDQSDRRSCLLYNDSLQKYIF
ncbi:prolyl 4-hydroxylase subunit alpha-2 [Cochliomyia hominivorax]